jgi:hypothetical protein
MPTDRLRNLGARPMKVTGSPQTVQGSRPSICLDFASDASCSHRSFLDGVLVPRTTGLKSENRREQQRSSGTGQKNFQRQIGWKFPNHFRSGRRKEIVEVNRNESTAAIRKGVCGESLFNRGRDPESDPELPRTKLPTKAVLDHCPSAHRIPFPREAHLRSCQRARSSSPCSRNFQAKCSGS